MALGTGNFHFAVGRPHQSSTSVEGDFAAIVASSASSTKTGYSSDNVSYEEIARVWRATGTAASWVSVQTTSSRSVDYVLIEGLNVLSSGGQVKVRANSSADLSSAPDSVDVTGLTAVNPLTKRASILVDTTGFSSRLHWGVYISGASTFDGTSEYAVGRITLIHTLREIEQNWGAPYVTATTDRAAIRDFPSGLSETTSTSGRIGRFDMTGTFDLNRFSTVEGQLRILQSAASQDRIVHFENRDDMRACYLCRRDGEMFVDEKGRGQADADLALIEAI